jgi:transketolase
LKAAGISIRVIDLYCVKPIDGAALAPHVQAAAGRLLTVEDHFPEGGIGEAVATVLAEAGAAPSRMTRLAIYRMPHSGKPDELVEAFGISANHIAAAVRAML